MSLLKKSSRPELSNRKAEVTLVCSGYLCPKADRCRRFRDAVAFHRIATRPGGADISNVVFQSPTINDNGKCVYFVEDLSIRL